MGLFSRILWEIDLVDRAKWAFHNGFAHPMMIILPRSLAKRLHDLTIPTSSSKEEAPLGA